MRAIISGAQGFIGRHMWSSLAAAGYVTSGFDIKQGVDAVEWFRHAEAPEVDVFVHAAAVIGGRANMDGNPLSIAQNFTLDTECIQWAIRNRPDKLVLFSSSAAYPIEYQAAGWLRRDVRLTETDIDLNNIKMPDATYGLTKIALEVQAQQALEAGIDVIIVRPFSGWGLDQDMTYPMPAFIARALSKVPKFDIWGDGSQTRDWIHVSDICAAIMVMIREDISGPINLSSGIGTSFDELAKLVCDLVGYEPEFNHILDAPQGVLHRVGNPRLLNEFYKRPMSLETHLESIIKGGQ